MAPTSKTPKTISDRAAIRPVAAASAMETMPVTNRLKTSGMTVIRSAFSQTCPRLSTTPSPPVSHGASAPWAIPPTTTPATRAAMTKKLSEVKKAARREERIGQS